MEDSPSSTTTQPKTKDPLDAIRDHVMAAGRFGYSYMRLPDILNMIDLAKKGELGDFKSL